MEALLNDGLNVLSWYHLNNPGRLEPVLLFSATNYTNFPFFFVLIREIRG